MNIQYPHDGSLGDAQRGVEVPARLFAQVASNDLLEITLLTETSLEDLALA